MFDIRVLPRSESGPGGQRLGQITIGEFSERFPCNDVDVPVDAFPIVWMQRLQSLLAGEDAVALVHDPRFAWIMYRVGNQCFVQQRFAIDGSFDSISPRQMIDEEGQCISDWPISLHAIAQFVTPAEAGA